MERGLEPPGPAGDPLTLAPIDGEGTRLVLVHAGLTAGAAGPHASFFWPVALARLRDELEDRPGRPRIKMVEPNG